MKKPKTRMKSLLQSHRLMLILIILVVAVTLYPKTSFGQIPTNNTIGVNSTRFVVPHTITNGTILAINLDSQSKAMILSIKSTNSGILTISLPRALINAKENGEDSHFIVLANKHGINFKEFETLNYRQLTMQFPNKTNTIEIIGTQVIPEFGDLAPLILVFSAILVITITVKTKPRFSF